MAQQAQRYATMVCNTVLHVLDRAVLLAAARQTRKSSAPGGAQGTAQQEAEHLDANLRDLHERRREKR